MPKDTHGKRTHTSPFIPSDDQLLWKKHVDLNSLTKSDARTAVNRRIREVAEDLALDPPQDMYEPYHQGHPVATPQVAVGHDDYTKLGRYYLMVCPNYNSVYHLISQFHLVCFSKSSNMRKEDSFCDPCPPRRISLAA